MASAAPRSPGGNPPASSRRRPELPGRQVARIEPTRCALTRKASDAELHSLVAAVEGTVREPVGRSYHLHQLDGARLEAMVYLDPTGVRIEWAHGKGDCAITGSGAAILSVLRDAESGDQAVAEGILVLYGDRDLIRAASTVFAPPVS